MHQFFFLFRCNFVLNRFLVLISCCIVSFAWTWKKILFSKVPLARNWLKGTCKDWPTKMFELVYSKSRLYVISLKMIPSKSFLLFCGRLFISAVEEFERVVTSLIPRHHFKYTKDVVMTALMRTIYQLTKLTSLKKKSFTWENYACRYILAVKGIWKMQGN